MKEVIRYAMIRNNIIENISLWNGDTFTWQPPEDILCIPAPDHVGIGWRYIDEQWLEPIIFNEPIQLDENNIVE